MRTQFILKIKELQLHNPFVHLEFIIKIACNLYLNINYNNKEPYQAPQRI